MKRLLLALGILTSIHANEISISHHHLNELTGNPDAQYRPVAIAEEMPDPTEIRRGKRKRFVITYSQVTQSEINSSFTMSPNANSSYQLNNDEMNEMMRENLELSDSHVIAVEYFLNENFSIELSDTYRHYSMDGMQVGDANGGNLLQGAGTFGFDQNDEIHDIQIGAKYSIKVVDVPNFEVELGAKATVGVVHLNSTSTFDFGPGQRDQNNFNDFAGYSYGVGLNAKVTLFEHFFLQGGIEQRNYVMAPIEYDNGVSHQIDQDGLLVFLGIGVQF
jgi:hypothetical protein